MKNGPLRCFCSRAPKPDRLPNGWDRYEAAKWLTMRRWLQANPNDELASEVRTQLTTEPLRHVTYTREYLGWGVFALMAR